MPSKLISLLLSLFLFLRLFSQSTLEQHFADAESLQAISYEQADSIYQIINNLDIDDRDDFKLKVAKCKLNIYWGLYDKALQNIEEAIGISEGLKNDTFMVKAIILKGDILLDKGLIDSSVELYLETIKEVEQGGKTKLLSMLYGSLAEVYRITDQLEYAFDYNSKALAIAKYSENEHEWAKVYNNLSATLAEQGNNLEAIDTLKKALELISDSNYYAEAKFYSNIGYSYRNIAQFDSALYYHKLALALKIKHQYSNTIWYSYNAIGRAFLGLKQVDSALQYLKVGFEHVKKYGNTYNLRDANIHLATAYAENQDFENAFLHLYEGRSLDDSIYEIDLEAKINLYQKKYDVAKKEQELESLKINQLLKEEQNRSRQFLLIGLLILAVFLAIIFGLLLNKRAQEKKFVKFQLEQSKIALAENMVRLKEFTNELATKNENIYDLNKELISISEELDKRNDNSAIHKETLTNLKILTDSDWIKFKNLFEKVYPQFFDRLRMSELNFTKGEKRIMALVKLNLNNQEAANLLGISSESVSKSKSRLKKKLESGGYASIEAYIDSI